VSTEAPPPIAELAQARVDARRERNFPLADRLRAEIEAAGWKVIDDGTRSRLEPLHPPDLITGGHTWYGWSGAVPSRLEEPETVSVTVVVAVTGAADSAAQARLRRLASSLPSGTSLVVAADAASAKEVDELQAQAGPGAELVLMRRVTGPGAAWNAGLRRATGGALVLLDGSLEPGAETVAPGLAALRHAGVAVAGPRGLRIEGSLPHIVDATFGVGNARETDGVEAAGMAFRRSAYIGHGPLEERFRTGRWLGLWWSLVLRPEGSTLLIDASPVRPVDAAGELGGPGARRDARRDAYLAMDLLGRHPHV
jgi:Glycosyl transferase family 2